MSNRKLTWAHHPASSHDCGELLTSSIRGFDRARRGGGQVAGGQREEIRQRTRDSKAQASDEEEEAEGAEWKVRVMCWGRTE